MQVIGEPDRAVVSVSRGATGHGCFILKFCDRLGLAHQWQSVVDFVDSHLEAIVTATADEPEVIAVNQYPFFHPQASQVPTTQQK